MSSQHLFAELSNLAATSEAFYSVDQVGPDGGTYRIFLYRLASYSDFLLPSALESRGIMFRSEGSEWELVSRPMEKFFNMGENPLTIGLDYSKLEYSMVKEDGSLISSYIGVDGQIWLKTKGSLHSDQAVNATAWMRDAKNAWFLDVVIDLENMGWTVNMEWTSPLNRIVVPYQCDKLIVLNARNRETGRYMDYTYLQQELFGGHTVQMESTPVHEVAAMQQGEGIVVFFGNEASPRFVKVKADAYLILHKLKDGVNQPNALFEAVIHEAVDDLRASFADDPVVQTMITVMEDLVRPAYNHFAATTEAAYAAYKDLDRKDFAIKMQSHIKEILPDDAGAGFLHGLCLVRSGQLRAAGGSAAGGSRSYGGQHTQRQQQRNPGLLH